VLQGASSSSTVFLVPIVYLLSSSPVVCEAQVVAAGSVQFDDHTPEYEDEEQELGCSGK
jgi:hypothetical protein